ncbi:MAG: hypothetical protein CL569_11390 [Alphaproteobacteria bacterium]|nr:hypothetical protein [Alphaproteobacteria bacterium]|tara:strand:+ start:325 stop:648 length:324 start_codon:yes stop_codon:yes gene_type:complete
MSKLPLAKSPTEYRPARRKRDDEFDPTAFRASVGKLELARIRRLVALARAHSDSLTEKQRFVLDLIGARIRRSGHIVRISDDIRLVLNDVEGQLFDLDDDEFLELEL